jgi:L-threonylcarbamoyladenylate synthase
MVLDARDPQATLVAVDLLRGGGVVAVPTDTVYGLAATIFNPDAVRRVFEVKRRPPEARVPVLLATAADLPLVTTSVPRDAWHLIDRFWPGAVTLVLPARPSVPDVVTGGGSTVAVRVPAARSCLRLLELLGEPVVGTSANVSGSPPATTAAAVGDAVGTEVDAILADDAAVWAGAPSTVVELGKGGPIIHRVGAVSEQEIRQALGGRSANRD